MDKLVYENHLIESSVQAGLTLRLRERVETANVGNAERAGIGSKTPLLLVHGATIPSILWDHPNENWSWMNRFARDGFHVYALDVRGYGGSSRLAELEVTDPPNHPPYARAIDVQPDIEDAMRFIAKRHGVDKVDLLGGSWGSITCGMFAASERASLIRRLVLYAPIYDEGHTKTSWWHGAVDPNDQTRVNPKLGAYRWVTRESLLNRWDEEIPFEDKSRWRPTEVFEPLFEACLKEDPASVGRDPKTFRAPNGTLVDLFCAYTGRPVFDAKHITVPTLLVRGDHDDTSSRIGSLKLFDDISAQNKAYVEVGNGAHFVILEHQAQTVHQAVAGFLNDND
jgi:pimeloyl-ACP methyl ester carboxylesterase